MKNKDILISVIVPCYNVETYVVKSINSILNQSYTNLEIWVIDDASTDSTLERINSIKDSRIKVITYNKNTQKVGAVNEVLQKVNGDFIAFQDADDWSEPNRIEEQLKAFEHYIDLGICFTNYRYFNRQVSQPRKIAFTDKELKEEFLNFTYKRKPCTSPTNCPTMMISREVLEKTKGYSPYFAGRVAEDIQWVYRILKDFKGITIDEVLYNYRIRSGSFSEMQSRGSKVKYAYSWQLLSKIIYKDIHEGVDVLSPENTEILKKLELEACEDALVEKTQLLNHTIQVYENSNSFKIGKWILAPWRLLKKLKP